MPIKIKKAWTTPAKKPSVLLARALDVLKNRKHWTVGTLARNQSGGKVFVNDYREPTVLSARPDVGAVCLLGAIWLTKDGTHDEVLTVAELTLASAIHGQFPSDIASFNDERRRQHRSVVAALKRAIAIAKKQEAQAK